VTEDIAACGYEVVTNDRPAPITVIIDPSIATTSPSHIACASGVSHDFCSSMGFGPSVTGAGGVTLRAMGTAVFNPEVLLLEIVPLDDVTLGARAFVRVSAEAGFPTCERALTPRLRFTGTLALSSSDLTHPELLHGRADLVLEGRGVVVSF
jgi:hypothetical protein